MVKQILSLTFLSIICSSSRTATRSQWAVVSAGACDAGTADKAANDGVAVMSVSAQQAHHKVRCAQ